MQQGQRTLDEGDAKGKAEAGFYAQKERHKIDLSKIIAHEFTERLTSHLLEEWGVSLTSMAVTDIQVIDEDVKKALAHGVKTSIDATNARRNAEASAETARIQARGQSDSERIRADGDAYRIREVARAQEEAGQLLERSKVAVTIRLAEAAAAALGKTSLVCAPDLGTNSLLGLLGATKAIPSSTSNL
jgi:regulator of protease activity HflC (stomatin/prohibitin superfamily)